MTGTSLDGVDLVYVQFDFKDENYSFQILKADCLPYPVEMEQRLRQAPNLSSDDLNLLDVDYGLFIGRKVNEFLQQNLIHKSDVSFVASHGYTVFHQPEKGFTLQIGKGRSINEECGIHVINDFRTKDVKNGGQGAPLVPIGDLLLFKKYDACLNLGGFSNISFKTQNGIEAFDVSPANLPLNFYASKHGESYDEGGCIGRNSAVIQELLVALNNLDFYKSKGPKSLGTEWLENEFYPICKEFENPIGTIYEHISDQLARVINYYQPSSVLVTGGGAYNTFLIELLKRKTKVEIHIPDPQIIEFKEALIFAFLGLRFLEKKYNCLAQVTGAKRNVIGGEMHS